MQTDVLIVGGGPVGLTLAIDLGRRGVACTLVEKNETPLGYPKMERCNPRTMEIFRRLGIVERVRAAGYPADWPMDNFLVFSMAQPPLLRMPFPSVAEAKAAIAKREDGTLPLEPYQIISQYTLEPLLKSVAEAIPNVAVKFGCEFESFAQDGEGVVSRIKTAGGESFDIRSKYLVGCDGGASAVRKQLGFRMEGEPNLMEMRQAMFRCDELFERVSIGRGRHYYRVDPNWTFLIVQDSRRHFTVHSVVGEDKDMPKMFETIVGTPVDYETIHIGRWTQRLLLATGYGECRVFIAGDAAHLVIPTGGLGMNTGVGDAIDLSWKLAATLAGWGGPGLLPSYETERRQIGARNVAASGYGTDGRKKWRAEYRPWIEDNSPEGEEARRNLVRVAAVEAPKSSNVVGAELGYRYVDLPIIAQEPGEGPPHRVEEYVPTTWPGARLPHVWIRPGEPVHDRLPDGYTLLRLGKAQADAAPLARAFAALGAPFGVLDIREGTARAVYGFDYLLVRPDLHVVWRGNSPPDDPERLARMVTGHETTTTN